MAPIGHIFKKIKIARFLQQVLASSQNIRGFFFKNYIFYSQIWLNLLVDDL